MIGKTLALLLLVASPVGAQTLTCASLNGAYVGSQESQPVYLGFFGSRFASESIMNQFGTYGSRFNQSSVRNEFGPYGSQFQQFSALNPFTLTPPVIAKAGSFVAFLTVNTTLVGPKVSLAEIDAACGVDGFLASAPVEPVVVPTNIPPQGGGGTPFTLKGSYGGTYYNAARDGEGIQAVIAGSSTPGRVTVIVTFYTYDLNGNPLYLVGAAGDVLASSRGPHVAQVVSTRGARFGAAFNPNDVVRSPWGTVSLTFTSCNAVTVSYQSTVAGYGSGTSAMTRIATLPADQVCP